MRVQVWATLVLITLMGVSLAYAGPVKTPRITESQSYLHLSAEGQSALSSLGTNLAGLRTFVIETEDSTESIASPTAKRFHNKTDFSFDALRWRSASRYFYNSSFRDGLSDKEQTGYTSHLWNGSAYYTYTQNPKNPQMDRLVIDTNSPSSEARSKVIHMLSTSFSGAPLMGYFYGCSERIDKILQGARSITLRSEREWVSNADCYVIDAITKEGQFTLWLSPAHGFNLAQAEMVKRTGDSFMDSPRPIPSRLEIQQRVRNVRFEKIQDIWMAMEADFELIYKDFKEPTDPVKNFHSKWHHRKTKVQLNPDFETLRTFEPFDVRNGTRVALFIKAGARIDQFYRWECGKLIPEQSVPASKSP